MISPYRLGITWKQQRTACCHNVSSLTCYVMTRASAEREKSQVWSQLRAMFATRHERDVNWITGGVQSQGVSPGHQTGQDS